MTDKLPPNLLVLFAPRPALRWVPPSDHAPEERKTATIGGLADFLPQLEEYKKTDNYVATESWLQRKDRVKLEKKQAQEKLLKDGPVSCKGDPLCFDHPLIFSPTSGQNVVVIQIANLYCVQINPKRIQIFVAMRSRLLLLLD